MSPWCRKLGDHQSSQRKLTGLQPLTLTIVLWKTNAEMDFLDFFPKEVLLVEKEDNGSGRKELVVANAVEQVQRLMHAILVRKQHQRCQAGRTGVSVCFLLLERPVPPAARQGRE